MGGVERAFRTKNKSTNSEGGKPKAHMGKLNPNSNPATYIHTHTHTGGRRRGGQRSCCCPRCGLSGAAGGPWLSCIMFSIVQGSKI